MSKIILPEGYVKPEDRKIITPKEYFLGAAGFVPEKDVLGAINKYGPQTATSDQKTAELRGLFKDIKIILEPDQVPLVAATGTKQGEIALFRKTMPAYKLVTIEETEAGMHLQLLGELAHKGDITPVQHRAISGDLHAAFARASKNGEVIVIGNFARISKGDAAQRFIEAAFYNGNIQMINGRPKGEMRDVVASSLEKKAPPKPEPQKEQPSHSKILLFRPKS